MEKEGVGAAQDNGRLPGPTGRVLMPNYPECLFPFFPLSFSRRDALTVNEWTHSNPQPGPTFTTFGLQPSWTRSPLPCASPRIIQSCGNVPERNARPPTFEIGPQSYVASVGTTIGPMRVLNFPAVSKKEKGDHRVLSTIVWGNRRSPAPRIVPSLPALQQRTRTRTTTGSISRHFPHKYTTYLFQIVHSGIFSLSTFFPLSRSSVRPASAPLWPLLRWPLGEQA